MAIFAPSNTSGYSDPLKAMSIKALEQRQKDMLAQQAAQHDDAATMATIPGGIGHVLGVVGDQLAQNRNMQAIAAQRDIFAKTIAGMDPMIPKPQELATIATADPESYRQMLTQLAEARRQQAGFTHADTSQQALFGHQDQAAAAAVQAEKDKQAAQFGHEDTSQKTLFGHQDAAAAAAVQAEKDKQAAQFGHEDTSQGRVFTHADTAAAAKVEADKAAAAEAARVAEEGRVAAEKRLQARPSDLEIAKAEAAFKTGEISAAERDAIVKKSTAPPAAEQNIVNKESAEAIENKTTLNSLDEAVALLNSPKGVHAGNYAGATQVIGEHLPGFLQGNQYTPDPETTKNTQRFNQIMDQIAMDLVIKMKGSSSDKDVDRNYKIASDKNAPKDVRVTAINVLKEKFTAFLANNQRAIATAGGEQPALPKQVGTATAAKPAAADPALAEAQDAINRGAPLDAVAEIFKQKGGDPAQLKPKAPKAP